MNKEIHIDDILKNFNPFITPRLVFKDFSSTHNGNGFAMPFLTVSFSRDGIWTCATSFTKEGKSNKITFKTPDSTVDFLNEIVKFHPEAMKYIKIKQQP